MSRRVFFQDIPTLLDTSVTLNPDPCPIFRTRYLKTTLTGRLTPGIFFHVSDSSSLMQTISLPFVRCNEYSRTLVSNTSLTGPSDHRASDRLFNNHRTVLFGFKVHDVGSTAIVKTGLLAYWTLSKRP